jgi:ATP-dependent Clp protease ATP-binding subunit ClpB
VIQKDLIDPIARLMLNGTLKDGDVIDVTPGESALKIGKALVH